MPLKKNVEAALRLLRYAPSALQAQPVIPGACKNPKSQVLAPLPNW
jgi:hypothetical protein